MRLRDYSLTAVATGLSARNLDELASGAREAPARSLIHHLWGRLLRADADVGPFGNDLAAWADRRLRDPVLAERLALVDPSAFDEAEDLRARVCGVLDARLAEDDSPSWTTDRDDAFHFVSDRMVVYDAGPELDGPGALADAVADASDATLFLHFVHPRALELPEDSDVIPWIRSFGGRYDDLADDLAGLDTFQADSDEIRARITSVLSAASDGGAS